MKKLYSWNVNGLRACMNKGFMDFLNREDPDVLCLQETKMQPEQADFVFPGYEVYWNSAVKKGYSGTAVLTKETPPGRKVQKYRTCKAVQQYIAHVKQKAGEQEHPKELVLRKLEAEVKLKESQGQLASIKADIAEGRYIETASAAQQLTEFLDTFKHFALNIPSRVAGTVAGYTDAATARAVCSHTS